MKSTPGMARLAKLTSSRALGAAEETGQVRKVSFGLVGVVITVTVPSGRLEQ